MFLFVSLIISSCFTSASAISNRSELFQKISNAYCIPVEDLQCMDAQTLSRFAQNIDNIELINTEVSYYCIETHADGTCTAYECSEATYDNGIAPLDFNINDGYSWISIRTFVNRESNTNQGNYGALFTWKEVPNFRMHDSVGIALRNGTIIPEDASGFYRCTTADGTVHTQYFTDFTPSLYGVTANFTLYNDDAYYAQQDVAYLIDSFYITEASDVACATYMHQKISLGFSPSFSIAQDGSMSASSGLNIQTSYNTATGACSASF